MVRWVLATVFLGGNALCFSAEERVVTLSVESLRVDVGAAVPLLHVEVPEAIGPGSGLTLAGAREHDWLREADDPSPFELRSSVDAGEYDGGVLTAWNWENEPIFQETIPSGNTQEISIRIEGLGSYLLTLDGISGERVTRRLIRNVARTEDLNSLRSAFRKDEFFLGICAFPGRYHWQSNGKPVCPAGLDEDRARNLEAKLLARLGLQVVRVDESMEMGRGKAEGEYQFDFARMDAAVQAYTSRGFDLALQFMNAPDWAILPEYEEVDEHRWRYPREETAQRAYVAALLERYGSHARFAQIFNEPDQAEFWAGTPEEFVRQFEYTRDEIRKHYPHLPIANGGYAFVDEEKVRYFAEHLQPWIDRPAYHSHGTLPNLIQAFSRMQAIHLEAGYEAPAFLNTETGFDAWRLDQERRQAQADVQKILYCWAHDHRGVMLFCGRMVKGPGREGRDLGLLDYEFCPRFAYAAVGGLVSMMAGATFEKVLKEDETTFVYQFRRGGDRVVAAFSLQEKGEEIVLHSDADRVTLADAMGNRRTEMGGIARLALGPYARYAVLRGAQSVSLP